MTQRGGGAGLKKQKKHQWSLAALPIHPVPAPPLAAQPYAQQYRGGEGPMGGNLEGPSLLPSLHTGIGSKMCSLPKPSQSEPIQGFGQSFQEVSNLALQPERNEK